MLPQHWVKVRLQVVVHSLVCTCRWVFQVPGTVVSFVDLVHLAASMVAAEKQPGHQGMLTVVEFEMAHLIQVHIWRKDDLAVEADVAIVLQVCLASLEDHQTQVDLLNLNQAH